MAEARAWVCLKLATPLTKGILSEVPYYLLGLFASAR